MAIKELKKNIYLFKTTTEQQAV